MLLQSYDNNTILQSVITTQWKLLLSLIQYRHLQKTITNDTKCYTNNNYMEYVIDE